MTAPVAEDGTWALPPGEGPCRTWPLDPMCGCLPTPDTTSGEPEPPDAGDNLNEQQRSAIETATEILWRLTAGRYGLCQDFLRPCRRACRPVDPYRAGPWPARIDGEWVNLFCRCTLPGDRCGCGGVDELALPGPVHYTPDGPYRVEVWIDGTLLDPTEYRYIGGNRIVRAGGARWPLCQDTALPVTEPGTWGIRYWRGHPVPPGGRRAVSLLACELAKACAGDESCQLPIGTIEIEREGVRFIKVNHGQLLDKGHTGLYEVDQWLRAVNPGRLKSPPQVYSVDLPNFLVDPDQPPGAAPDAAARPGTIHRW